MIKFEHYIERKRIVPVIKEIAQLMVECDVDPVDWLAQYLEHEEPDVFTLLVEAGFWQGVGNTLKDFGTKAWNTVRGAAGTLGDAGKQIGQQASNIWAGPQVKFQKAIQTVEALVKQMQGDPDLQQLVRNKGGNEIHQMLTNIAQRMRAYAAQNLPTQQQAAPTTNMTGDPVGTGNLGY